VDDIEFKPYQIFKTAEKEVQIYSEWLSGNIVWTMQVCTYSSYFSIIYTHHNFQEGIPPGATLLRTILSLDKTMITAMTGDRTAHPLLISLANMKSSYCAKSSHHAFLLLTLLPVPKFITHDKTLHGVLENHLLHVCLNFILELLKKAAFEGKMMSDPYGSL
jgi:hypothetical protein